VDSALLAQVRALREANDPLWTRFDTWVSKQAASDRMQGQAGMPLLFAHLVTGEKRYLDIVWNSTRKAIYKNGEDRSGGLLPILEYYKGDTHQAAYIGGGFIAQVAILYDWGYAQLTAQQRQDLLDWMTAATEYNYLSNHSAVAYFRNDGAAVTYGIAAAAYAMAGDSPEAGKRFEWYRTGWSETLKALDIMGMGGAAGEGNAYGTSPTSSSILRIANMVYYASGENLFTHPWFRKRLMYDAFATYPGSIGGPASTWTNGFPPAPFLEQSSIGGDGRRGLSWHNTNLRANGLMLSRRFPGTEEADAWNWVFRQPQFDQAINDAESYLDLLFYSPRPTLVKPAKLSYFDPSMGYVYIRSNWDSPDATWIASWAGPHLDTHEHLDQGAFVIYKRRDLAPKTGSYEPSPLYPHSVAWYTRTVSSNGLLIGDPKESFKNFIAGIGCDGTGGGNGTKILAPDGSGEVCPPNDGGQRTMSPSGLAASRADVFLANRKIFDVAKVVAFKDDGKAVAWVSDITNAYNSPRYSTPGNSPKVTKVYRRFVYLRQPDLLLVGDTVASTNPQFEKRWLIHSLDQLEVGGTVEKIAAGETLHTGVSEAKIVVDDKQPSDKFQKTADLRSGYAGLLLKTVFPSEFRYRKIGGREPAETSHTPAYGHNPPDHRTSNRHLHTHIRDFWVRDFSEGVIPNHKSFNWVIEEPHESAAGDYVPVFSSGYGRWRLEVEPTAKNKTDYFLNVLKPSLDPAETLPPVRKIETASSFGAEISAGGHVYKVLFGKEDLSLPQVSGE
jgi:hypothetical protein